jgi:sulfatase modifying factor 1
MWRTVYVVALCLIFIELCKSHRAIGAITIDTVPVGNPGNANDPITGDLYGGVANDYSIGKYDVTVGQYTAFLNAVAATDTYRLYSTSMATNLNITGIAHSGSSGSYTYSVIGSANHPVTFVSWFSAARFCNWLDNGQPTGAEGPATTDTGAYTLNGLRPVNAPRNANATWVIPTENEWYKAAYYDPGSSTYYQYPFSSDAVPTSASPGSTTPNTGNFYDNITGYAVSGSIAFDTSQNYLTDVGAYTASASPYGAFDMGGNVYQWNETLTSAGRGVRGGAWLQYSGPLQSSYRGDGGGPTGGGFSLGFRVALVPEPSTLALLAFGAVGFFICRARCAPKRCAMWRKCFLCPALFILIVGASLSWSLVASAANPIVVNFDDLPNAGHVPNGYGGLNWQGFVNHYTYNPTADGLYYGAVSGQGDIFSNTGYEDTFSISGGPFNFIGAYLTAAQNDGLQIDVRGLKDNVEVYSRTVTASFYSPTWFEFDFNNVDSVFFDSYGGIPVKIYDGTYFVMDDFTYSPVPEPTALALLTLGAVGLLIRCRLRIS